MRKRSEEALKRFRKKQMREVKAGEIRVINDSKTRGHNSFIEKKTKKGIVTHIPITHRSETRNMKNIKLTQNPNPEDNKSSYVLSKAQKTDITKVGKKRNNMKVKNSLDKSVLRHLKNKSKK